MSLLPFWILLFQHEEVQFLEIELENQKQKYLELASFTKSLLSAVSNNDLERQQVHSQSFLNTVQIQHSLQKHLTGTLLFASGTHG